MHPATTAENPFTVVTPLMGSTVISAPSPVSTLPIRPAVSAVTPEVPEWVTRIFMIQKPGLVSQK
jgi:hypothetical protein